MADIQETVGGWLLDMLAFFGIGLGGAQAAAASELVELQQDSFKQRPHRVHTPATLAEMVVKGVATEGDALDDAHAGGLSEERFAALVKVTGNPPGFETLLQMLRRGIITEHDVVTGIRQGYIKTEWAPFLLELRDEVLLPGQAVEAAVQNHLDYAIAETHAAHSGVTPFDFKVMFDNAGNPPGPTELLALWVRGYIPESELDQGLRESRLKDKWIPALKNLAIRKLPQRTVAMLLTHGAITDQSAVQHLRELGYSPEDAQAVVTAAHYAKAAPHKELSVTAVKELYTQHALSREQATADLVTAGYTEQVAGQLLDLADSAVLAALRKATIGRVRSRYVAHHIDRGAASKDLDALGVDAKQRDAMLTLWDLELTENARGLTEAQIIRAGQKKVFGVDEVGARLVALGYSADDANVLMMIAELVPNPNTPQPGV